MSDEQAREFASAKLSHSQYESLSLKAIHKILPFLRQGMVYSHAAFLANVPTIVGKLTWDNKKEYIVSNIRDILDTKSTPGESKEKNIKDFLLDNFDLKQGAVEKLYHPSMIEPYPNATKNEDGVFQLGKPEKDAIRNPMAMRSLHILRHVVNQLLSDKTIDSDTEVHVEYSRDLNDKNMRAAINEYQRAQDKKRQQYAADIIELYEQETGKVIYNDAKDVPDKDIRKFQLWEEQERISLYTGDNIGIADFIGPNPRFDIEHTVPQSLGGDSTMENLTLCESSFNRRVKRTLLPSQLTNHDDILVRIEPWKEKIESLNYRIDRIRRKSISTKEQKDKNIQLRHRLELERDYWRRKYNRFLMTEVPEDFSRRQGAGIGIISKYAGLYLKSLFHDKNDSRKGHVYVVKGVATMEFRKMWGLQDLNEAKSRDNHSHHCIDAITIACIGSTEYARLAQYYHDKELFDRRQGVKPSFQKPWPTFTEDVKKTSDDILIVHKTTDNMQKTSHWKVETVRGKKRANGDSARAKLHEQTIYGAIERDGEIKYVVRKPLSSLKEEQIKNIVDDTVRQKVLAFVNVYGIKALKDPNLKVYMNEEKGIVINKVRCYATMVKHPLHFDKRKPRDLSKKEYKQDFYVTNDSNYIMAIYEGKVKGKVKREVEYVNSMDAAQFFKRSNDRSVYSSIVPENSVTYGLTLLYKLRIGTMLLLYEKDSKEIDFNNKEDLVKRLYKVAQLDATNKNIFLLHHQEARKATDVEMHIGAYNNKEFWSKYRMGFNQLHALVNGKDFFINILGEIEPLNIKSC